MEENLERFNYYKSETELQMVNHLDKWGKKSSKSSLNRQKNLSKVSIAKNPLIQHSASIPSMEISMNPSMEMSKKPSIPDFNDSVAGDKNIDEKMEDVVEEIKEEIQKNEIIDKSVEEKALTLPSVESTNKIYRNSMEMMYSSIRKSVKLPDIHKKEKEELNEELFVIDDEDLLESLKGKIKLLLIKNFDIDSFTKKANFISKIVDTILLKMNTRIGYLDSVIIKKNKNLVLLRKETSKIAEKIQAIKALVKD